MAKARSPDTPIRGGSSQLLPDDIAPADRDVASSDREYPGSLDVFRSTNGADCSALPASDLAVRWLLPPDSGSTICKTIPGCAPISDRSSSPLDPLVSNGSLFVAIRVR